MRRPALECAVGPRIFPRYERASWGGWRGTCLPPAVVCSRSIKPAPPRPSPGLSRYSPGVEFFDLTPAQAEALKATVGCHLRHLNRLCDRMTHLSFPPGDPLYTAATAARNALQDVFMAAHYAGVKRGVGYRAREAPAEP